MLHNLPANLRRIRRACDLSQASLAASVGLTQQYVSALERGLRPADLRHLDALAQALGVSRRALLQEEHATDAPDERREGQRA
jgi:transcriptional regulator with XRE-family HTH domain